MHSETDASLLLLEIVGTERRVSEVVRQRIPGHRTGDGERPTAERAATMSWYDEMVAAGSENSEQVQQANVLKRQTLTLHFSTYHPNLFKHLSHHMPVRPHERIDCCDRSPKQHGTRSLLDNNTLSTISKLLTPNVYCWSRRILAIFRNMTPIRCSGPEAIRSSYPHVALISIKNPLL